ncbi:zinc-dependent alcohol dehydrogenase [Cellulomonas aerilata]|uniref:L-idonate 5-dehydrogenase n=1 Tax=Cellulomonas aerilata TaxID=515326 RepID=A0A512DCT7_9CELL|nr:zinc-binding dehydrogenase [Cellulomonas aerilata]GEO34275.1 L-idonate 5-dehydrogenase [Cellulomonas aerilata]
MKVARLHGLGDVRVGEAPDPVPGDGQSLVRVTAVGLCGSDLHWFGEGGIGDAQLTDPLVLGHEMAGVVQGGEHDGRRVAIDPAWPCGHCEDCLDGNRNLCRTVRFAGHGTNDGGLRELMAWPDHLLHPVPATLTDADVAMLEPLGVALHAHDLARPRAAETVAVVGCGPIGLCLVQLARITGAAQVVAVEPLEHRRAAAASMGADVVLDPADPGALAALLEATGGRGVDVAFEVAGNDAAVAFAVHAAAPGAQVILAGIPGQDTTAFPAAVARRKGLTLKLSRRMKEMYPRTTRLVERGLVDVRSVVSHTYGLDEVAEAFRVADARVGLKVVVEPNA